MISLLFGKSFWSSRLNGVGDIHEIMTWCLSHIFDIHFPTPRQARIDILGAPHHIMIRGLNEETYLKKIKIDKIYCYFVYFYI
jgi:hypothetical protein